MVQRPAFRRKVSIVFPKSSQTTRYLRGICQQSGYARLGHEDGRPDLFVHDRQSLNEGAIGDACIQLASPSCITGVYEVPVSGKSRRQGLRREKLDRAAVGEGWCLWLFNCRHGPPLLAVPLPAIPRVRW